MTLKKGISKLAKIEKPKVITLECNKLKNK